MTPAETQQIEDLKIQVDTLKKRLDDIPPYFGKRFSNALVSPNYIENTRGWKINENGTIEIGGISFESGGAITPTLLTFMTGSLTIK